MANLYRLSTAASARMMLVPLLFLGLLETTWMLPDHHQRHTTSTSSPKGGSGVQALWNASRGTGDYKRTIDGGVMVGSQQHLHGSERETDRATKMRRDESTRKKEVNVIDNDDGWNVTVNDATKKYSKDRLKDRAERVRTNDDQRDETTTIMTHHETHSLGWFLDTVAVNITAVPVVTWQHHRVQENTHSSDQGNVRSTGHGDMAFNQRNTHNPPSKRPESRGTLLTIEFRVQEQHLMLDLHPTRDLLTATYDEPEKEGLVTVCEYQGKVRSVAGSWAALSVCNGVRGVVVVGNQELLVEPAEGASTLEDPHRVFSASLLQDPPGACGVTESSLNQTSDVPDVSSSGSGRRRLATATRKGRRRGAAAAALLRGGRLWTLSTTRFVELVLVADRSYYRKHGDRTWARCRAIVNIVNAIYRPLGVVVVLSHVEVWKTTDQVLVLPDYKQTLENLRPYRQKLLKERPNLPHDNTVLLTVVDFEGITVGYATVSGMCSERSSVAVIQDKDNEVGVVSQTMAHEMGHNLGMHHDSQDDKCQCDTRSCIMSTTGSPLYNPNIGWSSCSKRELITGFESNDFDCLKNVPTQSFPGNSCGDGVVDHEAGEQCDCGPPEYCDNTCCLASTCKLAANASCANGACCNTETCQIEPGGRECREPRGSCDLPEYCTGESEYCPNDVYKRDGTSCREGKGHCYKGECGSHEGRCQEVWGFMTMAADPSCFTSINTERGSEGNCGFADATILSPCHARDSLCGTLHCLRLEATTPRLSGDFRYRTYFSSMGSCSYILASNTIPSSFWLSPNGAACTENKMCVNQRCVEIPPPGGHCRDGCSGRGICNSLGHCHCDAGYAPPDCSRYGPGGSVDSGPMRRPRNVHPFLDALFFLSMVLLAIAVLMCCLWDQLRGWWERKGRSSTLPCCVTCLDACCCPLMNKATRWMVAIDPPDKQENVQGKTGQEKETDKMLPQKDVDFKDYPPRTISSDIGHQKSSLEPNRPTYFQSISADSGCDVDFEEGVTKEPVTSQMSMTSLISTFNRFDFRSSRKASEENNRRSKSSGSKKSMPLSRFVVDPLAGNRSSRKGTPPPGYMSAAFRRSITVDATPSASSRSGRVPPLPPSAPKPCKSDSNLQSSPELENTHKVYFKERIKDSSNSSYKKSVQSSNYSQDPSDAVKESADRPTRKPMIPFQNPPSHPKVLPPVDKPPPPPIKESKKNHTTGPPKTNIPPQQDKSVAWKQTTTPKSKRQTHSLEASQTTPENTQPRGGGDATGSTNTAAAAPSGAAAKRKTVKNMAKKFEAGY